jgi:hypothetical protein
VHLIDARLIRQELSAERKRDLATLRELERTVAANATRDGWQRDRDFEAALVHDWLSDRDQRRARLGEEHFLDWLSEWQASANGNPYVRDEDAGYFAVVFKEKWGGFNGIVEIMGAQRRLGSFASELEAQRRAFDLVRGREE